MAIKTDDDYTAIETKRRMEEGLRRALSTPHKPNAKFVGTSVKGDSDESRKPAKKSSKKQ